MAKEKKEAIIGEPGTTAAPVKPVPTDKPGEPGTTAAPVEPGTTAAPGEPGTTPAPGITPDPVKENERKFTALEIFKTLIPMGHKLDTYSDILDLRNKAFLMADLFLAEPENTFKTVVPEAEQE